MSYTPDPNQQNPQYYQQGGQYPQQPYSPAPQGGYYQQPPAGGYDYSQQQAYQAGQQGHYQQQGYPPQGQAPPQDGYYPQQGGYPGTPDPSTYGTPSPGAYGSPPPTEQARGGNADFYGTPTEARVGEGHGQGQHNQGGQYGQDYDPAGGAEGERGLGSMAVGGGAGAFVASKFGVNKLVGAAVGGYLLNHYNEKKKDKKKH